MTLGCLRVGFSEFRNFRNFDFWSQIQAGSNLEKLGEDLGTYVLRSVWGLESHWGGLLVGVSWKMLISEVCSVNLGVSLGGCRGQQRWPGSDVESLGVSFGG